MKKLLLFSSLSLFGFFYSCTEPTGQSAADSDDTETAPSTPEVVVEKFTLNSDSSSAEWTRMLDQKPTKQKIKLFGKMVDVEMGAVTMTMNGNASLSEGTLTTHDGETKEIELSFDMSSFKLQKEAKQGLFDVVTYPNCGFVVKDINITDTATVGTGTLDLQGVTKDYPVTLEIQGEDVLTVKGTFTINTLDFPLREQVKAKDVNKDEIDVIFTSVFSRTK